MRLTIPPRLHSWLLHAARHFMLLLCVGAVVVAHWASRSMTALDVVSQHPAFRPDAPFLIDQIRKTDDPRVLKEACVLLAGQTEQSVAEGRKENALALTMTHKYFEAARAFSSTSAIVLLLAWVAAGGVLRSARATPATDGNATPA